MTWVTTNVSPTPTSKITQSHGGSFLIPLLKQSSTERVQPAVHPSSPNPTTDRPTRSPTLKSQKSLACSNSSYKTTSKSSGSFAKTLLGRGSNEASWQMEVKMERMLAVAMRIRIRMSFIWPSSGFLRGCQALVRKRGNVHVRRLENTMECTLNACLHPVLSCIIALNAHQLITVLDR